MGRVNLSLVGWRRLPRHCRMYTKMRGRRSPPLQLQECSRPNPDGGKGKRLVSLAGGKPRLPRLVQGVFQISNCRKETCARLSIPQVWIPYCSSDEHAGNRDASAETANLHFNGKNIVADVVDQLMADHLAGQQIEKIVIIGFSAGGAGVARNCDFMADRLAALGSTAQVLFHISGKQLKNCIVKVMCIMDGADFEPYWMTNRCDLILDERESAEFWVRSGFEPF